MKTRRAGAESNYDKIWAVVRRIPRGCVATYGQVAGLAGLPRRARLAGYAMHHAPPGLPWHRVVNAQGGVSLPGASGREQRKRLRAEGIAIKNGRIDLVRYRWRSGDDSPLLPG